MMSSVLKISEAANLAMHAMGYLAANNGRMVSTGEIAQSIKVSENHLQKVMQRLHKAGLVKSIRGPKGGFELMRPPEEIVLMKVYEAIEGALNGNTCLFEKKVCDGANCILGGMVEEVNHKFKEYMSKTVISDLTEIFGGKK